MFSSTSLEVNIFLIQAMKNRTKKIFVGGVPTEMEKEKLEEYFKQFGDVSPQKYLSTNVFSVPLPLLRSKKWPW